MQLRLGKPTTSTPTLLSTVNEVVLYLQELMQQLDRKNFSNLKKTGSEARKLLMAAALSKDFEQAIIYAYKNLKGADYFEVAVRSSATAEDIPIL